MITEPQEENQNELASVWKLYQCHVNTPKVLMHSNPVSVLSRLILGEMVRTMSMARCPVCVCVRVCTKWVSIVALH